MSAAKVKETDEEFCERAVAVYERLVKPKLTREDEGKFVAVDANTGEFEVDEDAALAIQRLELRVPNADQWLERAGYRAPYELSGIRSFTG